MFLIVLTLLNVIVFISSKGSGDNLIHFGSLMLLLCAPIIFFITLAIIGFQTGDGIAGVAAGLTFGVITFINGIAILVIGFMKKRK